MLSPCQSRAPRRDVENSRVVPLACYQEKETLTRHNGGLLHNPQGLLQLLLFLNIFMKMKKEQSCANPS